MKTDLEELRQKQKEANEIAKKQVESLTEYCDRMRSMQEVLARGMLMPSNLWLMSSKTWVSNPLNAELAELLATTTVGDDAADGQPHRLRTTLRLRFIGYLQMLGKIARALDSSTLPTLTRLYVKYGIEKTDYNRPSEEMSPKCVHDDITQINECRKVLAAELAFRDDLAEPIRFPDIPFITIDPASDYRDYGAEVATEKSKEAAILSYCANFPYLAPKDNKENPYLEATSELNALSAKLADATAEPDDLKLYQWGIKELLMAPKMIDYEEYLTDDDPDIAACHDVWETYYCSYQVWPEKDIYDFRKALKELIEAGLAASAKLDKATFEEWRNAKSAYSEFFKPYVDESEHDRWGLRTIDHLIRALSMLRREMRAPNPVKQRRNIGGRKGNPIIHDMAMKCLNWLRDKVDHPWKSKDVAFPIAVKELIYKALSPKELTEYPFEVKFDAKKDETEPSYPALEMQIRRMLKHAKTAKKNDKLSPYRKCADLVKTRGRQDNPKGSGRAGRNSR